MKIEMGESLIQSWLKHNCKCQITQLNWKASSNWEAVVPLNEIEKLFKELKKEFRLNDNDFVSRKMSLSQFIQQGEADCVGIKLKKENPTQVDKLFAVDVAFHEGGLNYGGKDETKARIIKKNIRTALTLYRYLGAKDAVIIFATPVVLKSHVDIFKEATATVEANFKKLGFNFEFRIYCNEDFYSEIYSKVLTTSQELTDTSELFSRSLKMVNLMNLFSNTTKPEINASPSISVAPTAETNEVKIGAMVREAFSILTDNELLKKEDVKQLCDLNYSKEIFGVIFPILQEKSDAPNEVNNPSPKRYYSDTYLIDNKEYMLCNHWFERNRDAFEKWYSKF